MRFILLNKYLKCSLQSSWAFSANRWRWDGAIGKDILLHVLFISFLSFEHTTASVRIVQEEKTAALPAAGGKWPFNTLQWRWQGSIFTLNFRCFLHVGLIPSALTAICDTPLFSSTSLRANSRGLCWLGRGSCADVRRVAQQRWQHQIIKPTVVLPPPHATQTLADNINWQKQSLSLSSY